MKKLLTILLDIVIAIVILGACCVMILTFSASRQDDGLPQIFGYIPLAMPTDSMKGTFDKGDLIITKRAKKKDLTEKSIVAYFKKDEGSEIIAEINRITDINDNGEYVVRGDNSSEETTLDFSDVKAKANGFYVPKLGYIVAFMQSKEGFLAFIIIPLVILFIYEIYKLAISILQNKKDFDLGETQKQLFEKQEETNDLSEGDKIDETDVEVADSPEFEITNNIDKVEDEEVKEELPNNEEIKEIEEVQEELPNNEEVKEIEEEEEIEIL